MIGLFLPPHVVDAGSKPSLAWISSALQATGKEARADARIARREEAKARDASPELINLPGAAPRLVVKFPPGDWDHHWNSFDIELPLSINEGSSCLTVPCCHQAEGISWGVGATAFRQFLRDSGGRTQPATSDRCDAGRRAPRLPGDFGLPRADRPSY